MLVHRVQVEDADRAGITRADCVDNAEVTRVSF